MNKKIILLSAIVILGALPLGQAVYAANPSLSILPATASKNVGTTFNVSVQLDPQGNKVCVVKGTLNLNALTCRGITVASGLMPQTTPTCKSPNFTLGIPQCTTAAQNLFTVSVEGSAAGEATASLAATKVIGVGVVISSGANGGTYNIIAVAAPTTAPTTTPETTQTVTPPVQQPTQQASAPTQNTTAKNGISESQTASLATAAAGYFWPMLIILIIVCVVFGIYYLVPKKKK